ncbi:helix-turn-helix domain-containing protein [Hymenobacter sp. DG01]|uniref:AlbA family DNA-binding domain-containing protein n=1 Tax=Hymenobacter sp. DG01 TaxID=2584940 RepID=UPI001120C3F3|nr:ATP-binding protein [Hymenobacter sp. DG01]
MAIQDIILKEGESTFVDFKKTAYKPEIFFDFIKDVMAMANAPVEEDRYLIVGVKHYVDNSRDLIGLLPDDLLDDAVYHQLLRDHVEPLIPFEYFYTTVQGKLIGVFRIYNTHPPYMMRKEFERGKQKLQVGDSFIRVGTSTARITRADIDQMFKRRLTADPFAGKLRVLLMVNGVTTATASTCADKVFPSEANRQKITRILADKREKERLDKEKAQTNWSTHLVSQHLQSLQGTSLAALAGRMQGGSRYEDRTIEQLEKNLAEVESTYREHDLYAKFEEQAHQLNFLLVNDSDQYVEDCSITITFKNDPGVSIATKIHPDPAQQHNYSAHVFRLGYPSVQEYRGYYMIEGSIKSIKHGVQNEAFQQALRLYIPGQAAGQQLLFKVALTAKNLKQEFTQELVLTIQ